MRRTPVLAVDHVRLQLAETEAGALRECLQGCLAYTGCVEICTVHVHIVTLVHRTVVALLSAVERVLHLTHCCQHRAQPLHNRHAALRAAPRPRAPVSHKDFIYLELLRVSRGSPP